MADDEELAEHFVEVNAKAPRELISEWSPEREAIATVQDILGALYVITVMAATNGKSKPKHKPAPRPVTAAQRLKKRREREGYDALVKRVRDARAERDARNAPSGRVGHTETAAHNA